MAAPFRAARRSRIALARAFFGDPALLVLDEPNASIDRAGAENLDRALRQAARDGVTVVVMTHRPSALAACDMLLVLDGGRLRAFGPRDRVLAEIAPTAGHHAPPLIRPAIA
jgi:ATP-binding cassette subfamily C protein